MKKIKDYEIMRNYGTEFDYSDYVEECSYNGIEPNENNFAEWCSETEQMYFDDDMENVKYSHTANVPVLLEGSVGTWRGAREICPIRFENVYEALYKSFGECDYIVVEMKDGIVNVKASHHDGTNYFTISPLSKKGIDRLYNNYDGYVETEVKGYHTCKFHDYLF